MKNFLFVFILLFVPMITFSINADSIDSLVIIMEYDSIIILRDVDNNNFYEIKSSDDLLAFAKAVNNGNNSINGELTSDISFNKNLFNKISINFNEIIINDNHDLRTWEPIGNDTNPYKGIFNGQNKNISGLFFNKEVDRYIGLFGYTDNAIIQNINVVESCFSGKWWIGGIVGYNNGIINNCLNDSYILSTNAYAGGICGENHGTILNSINKGEIIGSDNIGGIVGYNKKNIYNSYNKGKIDGSDEIGGIAGYNSDSIYCCYNEGEINGSNYVGGVVGNNQSAYIKNSYNTGNICKGITFILNSGTKIGGVVGYDYYGYICNCYNIGLVNGKKEIGGVAGNAIYKYSKIENCYYLNNTASGGVNNQYQKYALGKDSIAFKSGEVTYLLNNSTTEGDVIWRQKIDNNDSLNTIPTLNGPKVYYGYISCSKDAIMTYTNDSTASKEKLQHTQILSSLNNTIQLKCPKCDTIFAYATITCNNLVYGEIYDPIIQVSEIWEDTTFDITYKLNEDTLISKPTDVGTYTASISINRINASVHYSINQASLFVKAKDNTIVYGEEPVNNGVVYSGFVNEESVNVLDGELEFSYNYNKFNSIGIYNITPYGLSAKNYIINFIDGNLTVIPQKIETVDIIGLKEIYEYNGNAIEPKFSIFYEGIELSLNEDYTITFSNNINIGSATVTINFIGNYTGMLMKNFEIKKSIITKIDGVNDQVYTQFYIIGNNLYVDNYKSNYLIFDVLGHLIYSGNDSLLYLNKGIYILVINDEKIRFII